MGLADDPIKIVGLRDLQAALKATDGQAQKQLRVVLNDAADVIATGAQRLVPRGPSGRARGSLRATSGQREAKVSGGGSRAPYYAWLDFGGAVGRAHAVRRPFLRQGRYIFATYARRRPWVLKQLADGLDRLIERAGLG